MSRQGTKPAIPDAVDGAAQAWRITAVLQLVLGALMTVAYWQHPELLMGAEAVRERLPGISDDQIQVALKSADVIGFVFTAVVCALFFAVISRMRAGSGVARTLLVIGSVYLALSAAMTFFSAGSATAVMPAVFVLFSGALQIVSATAAIAGLVLVSSAEAKAYFHKQQPTKPWSLSKSHVPQSSDRSEHQHLPKANPTQSSRQRGTKSDAKPGTNPGPEADSSSDTHPDANSQEPK